jgi:hypothetical protein
MDVLHAELSALAASLMEQAREQGDPGLHLAARIVHAQCDILLAASHVGGIEGAILRASGQLIALAWALSAARGRWPTLRGPR